MGIGVKTALLQFGEQVFRQNIALLHHLEFFFFNHFPAGILFIDRQQLRFFLHVYDIIFFVDENFRCRAQTPSSEL